jgi:hypothetical protein
MADGQIARARQRDIRNMTRYCHRDARYSIAQQLRCAGSARREEARSVVGAQETGRNER